MTKPVSTAVSRTLDFLERIVEDDGATSATTLANLLDIAPSTARRMAMLLADSNYIMRIAKGRYAGGERLAHLAARINPHHRIIEAARPVLRRLAHSLGGTAHLGVLDQDMVTYLVKEGERAVFTREREQLEAYCSGIGKALLAELMPSALNAYLETPLVRLTAQTIIDPDFLRIELDLIRTRGYSIDDREMADDLSCVAMPLRIAEDVVFAISLSGNPARMSVITVPQIVDKLVRCKVEIRSRIDTHFSKTNAPDLRSS